MVAPLEGIKVVEIANWLAAPAATAMMRDLGADVVKVEPPEGDVLRGIVEAIYPGKYAINPVFEVDNRGKRSVTVALDHAEGPGVVHALVREADVVLTNLTGPRMARYQLGAAEVHALNPRAVHVSLTGYGSRGPDASRPGFDYAAFWARSGIMGLIGEPESAPMMCRSAQGDHTTSLNLLASTLAALRLRDLTGEGQSVEVTLQGTGIWTIAMDVSAALAVPEQPPRHDRARPVNPIWNTYAMADGRWVLLVMPAPDAYWPSFCEMVGRPEWVSDPRYDTLQHRAAHAEDLTAQIAAMFVAEGAAYWGPRLDEYGLIWAPVADLPEVVADPQLEAMEAFVSVDYGAAGTQRTLNTPFTIWGADVRVRGRAPELGEHSAEVLAEAGLSEVEVAELAAKGVLG
jgi:crotonobetainyl-CoA:carnitine CoA-transferase CaiB-like acyl-CoA transferase